MIHPKKKLSRRKKVQRVFTIAAVITGVTLLFNSRPTVEEKVQIKIKNQCGCRDFGTGTGKNAYVQRKAIYLRN